jgi:hypothetical protein
MELLLYSTRVTCTRHIPTVWMCTCACTYRQCAKMCESSGHSVWKEDVEASSCPLGNCSEEMQLVCMFGVGVGIKLKAFDCISSQCKPLDSNRMFCIEMQKYCVCLLWEEWRECCTGCRRVVVVVPCQTVWTWKPGMEGSLCFSCTWTVDWLHEMSAVRTCHC